MGNLGLEEMEEDPLLSQNPLLNHLDRLRGARSLNLNLNRGLSLGPVTPMSHKVITTDGGS